MGEDYLRATMPVDDRTRQIMGVLHGGASAALAETIGSFAANMCVDHEAADVRWAGDQRQPPAAGGERARHARRRGRFTSARAARCGISRFMTSGSGWCACRGLTMAVVERRENGNGG